MVRALLTLACALTSGLLSASEVKTTSYPTFPYNIALSHEIRPHRRIIPFEGVVGGFNQMRITLTVTPAGDVIEAAVDTRNPELLKIWPQLQVEVLRWKFTPFEDNGNPVTAQVEEHLDLVPAERLPKIHVAPPVVLPTSNVTISLKRSGCYGTCPSYTVSLSTGGIVFDGGRFVSAPGKHTDGVDADVVRKLAQKFVSADFYSMDLNYEALVTDGPTYTLSITIDGHTKVVEDYVGSWVGMPAVITELEDDVDSIARTRRWVQGDSSDWDVQVLGPQRREAVHKAIEDLTPR
jgi:Domain of unknown function (DUF6438)